MKDVKVDDYLAGHADAKRKTGAETDLEGLKAGIVKLLTEKPTYYLSIVQAFPDFEFSTVVNALGQLHQEGLLWQDDIGRPCNAQLEVRGEASRMSAARMSYGRSDFRPRFR